MRRIFEILKEEILTLPVLVLLLFAFKRFLTLNFPTSAQYDIPSEIESLIYRVLKLIVYTSLSWLTLRIVFPQVFKSLRDDFYHRFDKIDVLERRRVSLAIFFSLLFALCLLSCSRVSANEADLRLELSNKLKSQLSVREATGNNDGKEVEMYLESVGLKKGNPWCAAYCSYNLKLFRVPNPSSGWSPNFALQKDIIWSQALIKQGKVRQMPQVGDCFTIYFPNLKRVGHVGFIVGESGNYFITNEGNTNVNGSREGDGVYSKKREKAKVYAVSNYITPKFKTNANTTNHFNKSTSFRLQASKEHYSNRYAYHRKNSNHQRYCCANKSRHSICKCPVDQRYSVLSKAREGDTIWGISIREIKNELSMRFSSYSASIIRDFTEAISLQNKRSREGKVKLQRMAFVFDSVPKCFIIHGSKNI